MNQSLKNLGVYLSSKRMNSLYDAIDHEKKGAVSVNDFDNTFGKYFPIKKEPEVEEISEREEEVEDQIETQPELSVADKRREAAKLQNLVREKVEIIKEKAENI